MSCSPLACARAAALRQSVPPEAPTFYARWVVSFRLRVIVGVALAFLGLIWALQGFDVLGGSGMSGQPIWAVIGSFLVVVGVLLILGGRRAGPPPRP